MKYKAIIPREKYLGFELALGMKHRPVFINFGKNSQIMAYHRYLNELNISKGTPIQAIIH